MIRLRVGYLITGILTGLLLVLSFFTTIPDGKLHVTICDVGQGDGIHIRFPDGKDVLIDGGPNNKIIGCLSRSMPFWDRTIDMAILTHPQKDHMGGLLSVLERYDVEYFVRSDVTNATDGFEKLGHLVKQKNITEKLVTAGETIDIGAARLSVVWPSKEQIALMKPPSASLSTASYPFSSGSVLGSAIDTNVNDASVVLFLSYGTFDALFMGDADSHIQPRIIGSLRRGLEDPIELLKVPHHGSKTGMTTTFLNVIMPNDKGKTVCFNTNVTMKQFNNLNCPLAVISVGNNSYGHPSPEIMQKLESAGFQVKRTDKEGDIEVVSDGKDWEVRQKR